MTLNCTGSSAYALQTDMTNLFDYCFNNFTAVTYTAKELAPTGFQTPVYSTDADGNVEMIGTATYSTDSDFTVLLHKNFTKDDIVISSDIPGRYYEGQEMPSTLTFSIVSSKTEEAMNYMVPTMTALKLKVSVLTFSEVEAQKQQARQELFNRIFNIVKIVFFVRLFGAAGHPADYPFPQQAQIQKAPSTQKGAGTPPAAAGTAAGQPAAPQSAQQHSASKAMIPVYLFLF